MASFFLEVIWLFFFFVSFFFSNEGGLVDGEDFELSRKFSLGYGVLKGAGSRVWPKLGEFDRPHSGGTNKSVHHNFAYDGGKAPAFDAAQGIRGGFFFRLGSLEGTGRNDCTSRFKTAGGQALNENEAQFKLLGVLVAKNSKWVADERDGKSDVGLNISRQFYIHGKLDGCVSEY